MENPMYPFGAGTEWQPKTAMERHN